FDLMPFLSSRSRNRIQTKWAIPNPREIHRMISKKNYQMSRMNHTMSSMIPCSQSPWVIRRSLSNFSRMLSMKKLSRKKLSTSNHSKFTMPRSFSKFLIIKMSEVMLFS
ncbi:hypothetical protein PMAYCL1PPCAC_22444, partial [Pristionchus mayeri]